MQVALSTFALSSAIAANYTLAPPDPGAVTIVPASETILFADVNNGTNLYQGTVALSCGSLPANVTCIFSPSTFTFTGGDITSNPTMTYVATEEAATRH